MSHQMKTPDQIFPKSVLNRIEDFDGKSMEEIKKKLIEPNLDKINELTGQENDAGYLSYLVIYLIGEAKKG